MNALAAVSSKATRQALGQFTKRENWIKRQARGVRFRAYGRKRHVVKLFHDVGPRVGTPSQGRLVVKPARRCAVRAGSVQLVVRQLSVACLLRNRLFLFVPGCHGDLFTLGRGLEPGFRCTVYVWKDTVTRASGGRSFI